MPCVVIGPVSYPWVGRVGVDYKWADTDTDSSLKRVGEGGVGIVRDDVVCPVSHSWAGWVELDS